MSNVLPSTTAANGRDGSGRFARGNGAARGNPHARRVARLRAELLRAVSPQDLREVVVKLMERAKGGDVASAKELLQRLLGPPTDLDLVQRLESLEALIEDLQRRTNPT
jgi:hypothetical protein